MTTRDQVNMLLDRWEDQCHSNTPVSLDRFINDQLQGTPSAVIRAFRQRVAELAAMDRQIEHVAGLSVDGNLSRAASSSSARPLLTHIRPGFEPIPGYRLVSRLGSGGFGEVWKAESPGGFHVALKFVQIGGRVGEVEERSLDVIKDVRHPNLLSIFGTWRIGDWLIIATELADRTLLDRFHEAQIEGHQGIPRNELLRYMAEAAKGIDALNDPSKSGRKRIQHRDIKPQNLLLSGGSVKVGDFGLARLIQHDVTGHTGSLTFSYAAPECFDGTTSNHTDQYSLAITYCHLRGGRLPFIGTPVEIMEGHRKEPPDLSMLPAEERSVIAKALAKLPKDRWGSCTEFVQGMAKSLRRKSSLSPTRTLQHSWTLWFGEFTPLYLTAFAATVVALTIVTYALLPAGGSSVPHETVLIPKSPPANPGSPLVANTPTDLRPQASDNAPILPTVVANNESVPPQQVADTLMDLPPQANDNAPLLTAVVVNNESAPPQLMPQSIPAQQQPAMELPGGDSNASDWKPLFDGRSLTGWSGDVSQMYIANGVLVNDGKRGVVSPPGIFRDAEIEVEFRLQNGGNSGLGIYYSGSGDPAKNGLEIQLIDDEVYPDIGATARCGAIFNLAASRTGHFKRWPEWNRLHVTVHQDAVKVELNGILVTDTTRSLMLQADPRHAGLKRKSGRVCLFPLTGRSEYRTFRIRPLNPKR